jgi:hypothetical protein
VKRFVRVTDEVFERLEALLPAERGEDGRPTLGDFLNSDLVRILEHFADYRDDLPRRFPERPDYRLSSAVARTFEGSS